MGALERAKENKVKKFQKFRVDTLGPTLKFSPHKTLKELRDERRAKRSLEKKATK